MSDFASAAMVRVLAQGMRELGLRPPAEAAQAGTVATVALDLKRLVVTSAVEQGGLGCLALLGRGLHHYRHDPTHIALVSARSAEELFVRWARLERYIHSRHRCEILSLRHGQARLRHVSRGALPPLAAEDLVVLGLLAALLEALGLQAVHARAGEAAVYPQADTAALERAVAAGRTGLWQLDWRGEVAPRPSPSAARRRVDAPSPRLEELVVPQSWPAPLGDCAEVLLADLAHPTPLPALAAALKQAPRSLQRSLTRAGLGYAPLLAELRCRAAAWWLLRSTMPIAEVGFVCGFADQPHFTRELQRRVGLPPARYREAFAAAHRSAR